jgi:Cu(I)/Ag(I) efflux system membrane protein CusA/SilA
MAVGGMRVTTTVEGRERYGVTVRFPRDTRDSVENLRRVLLTTSAGTKVQLGQVADISLAQGPAMIRNENGLLAAYVFVDFEGRDLGGYLADARRAVEQNVKLPAGVNLLWSGQYENMQRAARRFAVMVPLALIVILFLIYQTTRSATETFIVLLAVPFSLIGAVWLLYILDYNLSVAVWVGLIALAGLDAETGVIMLLYLSMAYKEKMSAGGVNSEAELRQAVFDGAVKRIRPKMMTVGTLFFGLLPIMISSGIGSDVMKRIAAPMVGGVATSFLLELLVYPVVFASWKWHTQVRPRVEGIQPTGFWKLVQKIG